MLDTAVDADTNSMIDQSKTSDNSQTSVGKMMSRAYL